MNIQCDNCGTQHELDPPSWVMSSGRAFRFRCSACGSSQSVLPKAPTAPIGSTGPTAPTAPIDRSAAPTVVPADRTATPVPSQPSRTPTVAPPALLDSPSPAPVRTVTPPPVDDGVFLKQSGQIYSVRDWPTLERWITERRVDQNDLVSEGGVRWEPIGSRPELAPLFGLANPPTPANAPSFPFGADTPFGAPTTAEHWNDEDTEGIPLGLPPLPNEESTFDPEPREYPSLAPASDLGPDPDELDPLDASDPPLPERGIELGGPEPWELGLLEPDPGQNPGEEPSMVEDDIDTPFTELRYDPTEEVIYSEDAFDTFDGADPVDGVAAEVQEYADEPDMEGETEHLPGPSPDPVPSRLDVVPSPHPSPNRAYRGLLPPDDQTLDDDVLSFDQSTQPGPDRLPPTIDIPRVSRSIRNPVAGLSPSGTVTQLRRPPPKTSSSGPREAPTLEPLTEFPFDVEWDEEQVRKSPRSRWLLGAAVVATFFALVVVAWFVGPMIGGSTAEPAITSGAPASEVPVPTAAAPTKAPAPVLKPAPEVLSAPTPAPAPPPKVVPPAEPTESVTKLIKRGWDLADDDRPKAEKLFRRAVDLAPADDEAAYGYGYVLLMQGREADATKYLCRARKAQRADTRQDVNGMIANYGLKCP